MLKFNDAKSVLRRKFEIYFISPLFLKSKNKNAHPRTETWTLKQLRRPIFLGMYAEEFFSWNLYIRSLKANSFQKWMLIPNFAIFFSFNRTESYFFFKLRFLSIWISISSLFFWSNQTYLRKCLFNTNESIYGIPWFACKASSGFFIRKITTFHFLVIKNSNSNSKMMRCDWCLVTTKLLAQGSRNLLLPQHSSTNWLVEQ